MVCNNNQPSFLPIRGRCLTLSRIPEPNGDKPIRDSTDSIHEPYQRISMKIYQQLGGMFKELP